MSYLIKTKEIKAIEVDAKELQNLILERYGHKLDIEYEMREYDGSYIPVSTNTKYPDFIRTYAQMYKDDVYLTSETFRCLLCDMAMDGIIPEGNYIIENF